MPFPYEKDDRFEEKCRAPEGYYVEYQGLSTHIHWSDRENVFYGEIEWVPELVVFRVAAEGCKGYELQCRAVHEFVRAVNNYVLDHPEAVSGTTLERLRGTLLGAIKDDAEAGTAKGSTWRIGIAEGKFSAPDELFEVPDELC